MSTALIVYGGLASHEPRGTSELVARMLSDEGFTVTLSESLDTFCDAEALRTFDLIVPNWSVDTITDDQANGLVQAVEAGVNLACWHGGLTTLKHAATSMLIGGQFLTHPGGIIDYPVHITAHDDPITAGLDDFVMHSEQYYMHVDPANTVLATTTFSGEHLAWIARTVMPVVWTRQWGQGRIFYSALGHNVADFEIPQVTELLRRGMRWAAGKELS